MILVSIETTVIYDNYVTDEKHTPREFQFIRKVNLLQT